MSSATSGFSPTRRAREIAASATMALDARTKALKAAGHPVISAVRSAIASRSAGSPPTVV